ncbi:orotate phosphoribosyltransferase [Kordiimonas sp. SCSIO 12603]|uniref:orotate phosphoribosyltransferase n=1 Tax=Kordiimonas sp. SCSIO 12603 TaxID=2829596 RepID=UPI002102027F|nr:orotate phosphoribosyltransferase [Kordiimonas sp. SCSIO 12603]UTW57066.1 orotate phosphoribosyltransferase [Kordiimonas sp. SCSIO 12603]
MDQEAVLNEFRAAGALLEGHFKLSSGLHSPVYLQCAKVLMDPQRAGRLCAAFAEKLKATGVEVDLVVSPAMGGVIVGYEVARQLGVLGIFTERVDGEFALRRGFEIPNGAKILMMEDIITTGLSSRECIKTITEWGGEVVAAGCLINRSGGRAEVGAPVTALATIDAPTYKPEDVPAELAEIPAIKPGSRGLKS